MRKLFIRWPVAVVGLALGCAACGGEDEPAAMNRAAAGADGGAGSMARPTTPVTAGAGSLRPPQTAAGGPARPANPAPIQPITPPPAAPAAGSGVPPTMPAAPPAMVPPPPPAAPATPPGTWPAADPGKTGPFETVMEGNVGPGMAFTMWRPMMLTQKHPVITWGNGTGTTPPTYATGLDLYASHGFIVIASNSENVGQGTPPPMLQGVTWVLEQDMTEGSALYQHVDRDRVGATGHSQGAFAASTAGSDPVIKTVAPIQALGGGRFHGPVLGLCGTMDTIVSCSGNLRGYQSVSDQPAMYAELKSADHTNWIFSGGGVSEYYVITTAWFRVHLMDDTALRPMFYGECSLCKDEATWITMRKMMDN